MRSTKLNFSATVLTLGLKAKMFENLRLCEEDFWRVLRTRPTFDRCVGLISLWARETSKEKNLFYLLRGR